MRLAKIIAIAGLALILLGVVLAAALMAQVTWEPKSDTLVSESTTVSAWFNYTRPFSRLFARAEDVRNLVVKGHIEEAGGRPFDLEVSNGKVYAKAANVSSYDFKISPSPAELSAGLKLVIANVRAAAPVTESFVKETVTVASFANTSYTFAIPLVLPPRKVPVEVRGIAKEKSGYKFSFYAVDKDNLALLEAGAPFKAYYAGKGAPQYEYSFVVPAEKCTETVYFVAERVRELRTREENFTFTVSVFSYVEWGYWWYFPPPLFEPVGDVTFSGKAAETKGYTFDLLILSEEDLERYRAGAQPLSPYFTGRGKSSYEFSFTVPAEKARKSVYFVVKRAPPTPSDASLAVLVEGKKRWSEEFRPELNVLVDATKSYPKPVDITVRYTIEASWEERSYAGAVAGMLVGGGLAGLGLLLLIAAAIVKFVFKK
jgi:hypothetical protein